MKVQTQACQQERRRGAATVEFALCLPLMILLVFGSIEACNAIFLRQAATIAAYEAAQIASSNGGTRTEAEQRAAQVLTARGITVPSNAIQITPNVNSQTRPGTTISVSVTVPANANSIGPAFYYQNSTLTSSVVMTRL